MQRERRFHHGRIVGSLSDPSDELNISRAIELGEQHLVRVVPLGAQLRHKLHQQRSVADIEPGGGFGKVRDLRQIARGSSTWPSGQFA
jgi:hypothetical protein